MTQPPDQGLTRLDTFIGDTMAGILATLETALDPSGRLAALLNSHPKETN